MTGLINLITQYSSKLNILPIVVVMNIIITVLIHFLTKKKFPKFLLSLLLGIGALALLIYSLKIFTSPRGLDITWIAVFLGTSALVGLFTCFIIDLVISIRKTSTIMEKNEVYVAQKPRNIRKKKSTNIEKARVAKKTKTNNNSKDELSKFNTKKIKANPDGKVKANRKNKLKDKDIITFESED